MPAGVNVPVSSLTGTAAPASRMASSMGVADMPAYNGGDAFAVDLYPSFAPVQGGDAFALDLYPSFAPTQGGDAFAVDMVTQMNPGGTGMSAVGVDVQTLLAAGEGARASIGVDMMLTQTPSPARLKRWDGNQWVPVRVYYYDPVTNAWVMNG